MDSIQGFLGDIFHSTQYADCEMELWDTYRRVRLKTYKLHKIFLMQCTYFKAMMQGNFLERNFTKHRFMIDIRCYSLSEVDRFFRLLYVADFSAMEVNDEELIRLYHLCSFAGYERGKSMCLHRMRPLVEVHMKELLQYALEHEATHLEHMCKNWLYALGKIHGASEVWKEEVSMMLPAWSEERECANNNITAKFALAISPTKGYSKRWNERAACINHDGTTWNFHIHRNANALVWNLGINVITADNHSRHWPAKISITIINRKKRITRVENKLLCVNGTRQEVESLIVGDDVRDGFEAGVDFSCETDRIGAGHFIGNSPSIGDLCLFFHLDMEIQNISVGATE